MSYQGVPGFNVGVAISLGDMSLVLDYINDAEAFEPELGQIKQEIKGNTEELAVLKKDEIIINDVDEKDFEKSSFDIDFEEDTDYDNDLTDEDEVIDDEDEVIDDEDEVIDDEDEVIDDEDEEDEFYGLGFDEDEEDESPEESSELPKVVSSMQWFNPQNNPKKEPELPKVVQSVILKPKQEPEKELPKVIQSVMLAPKKDVQEPPKVIQSVMLPTKPKQELEKEPPKVISSMSWLKGTPKEKSDTEKTIKADKLTVVHQANKQDDIGASGDNKPVNRNAVNNGKSAIQSTDNVGKTSKVNQSLGATSLDDEEKILQAKLEELERKKKEARLARLRAEIEAAEAEINGDKDIVTVVPPKQQVINKPEKPTGNAIKNNGSSTSNTGKTDKKVSRPLTPEQILKKHKEYESMTIDSFYTKVREYMIANGVQKAPIDIKQLEAKFGKSNINKLVWKSYIILKGRGVTIGR